MELLSYIEMAVGQNIWGAAKVLPLECSHCGAESILSYQSGSARGPAAAARVAIKRINPRSWVLSGTPSLDVVHLKVAVQSSTIIVTSFLESNFMLQR